MQRKSLFINFILCSNITSLNTVMLLIGWIENYVGSYEIQILSKLKHFCRGPDSCWNIEEYISSDNCKSCDGFIEEDTNPINSSRFVSRELILWFSKTRLMSLSHHTKLNSFYYLLVATWNFYSCNNLGKKCNEYNNSYRSK